ncbi:hypothetical protein ACFQDF_31830 [Ectobacillus funiculus]
MKKGRIKIEKFARRSNQNQNETKLTNTDTQPIPISLNLSDNLQRIKEIFSDNDDFVILHWRYGPEMKYTAFSIYFKTLIQHKELNYMKESLQDLVTHEVGPGTTITPEDVMSFRAQWCLCQLSLSCRRFREGHREGSFRSSRHFF